MPGRILKFTLKAAARGSFVRGQSVTMLPSDPRVAEMKADPAWTCTEVKGHAAKTKPRPVSGPAQQHFDILVTFLRTHAERVVELPVETQREYRRLIEASTLRERADVRLVLGPLLTPRTFSHRPEPHAESLSVARAVDPPPPVDEAPSEDPEWQDEPWEDQSTPGVPNPPLAEDEAPAAPPLPPPPADVSAVAPESRPLAAAALVAPGPALDRPSLDDDLGDVSPPPPADSDEARRALDAALANPDNVTIAQFVDLAKKAGLKLGQKPPKTKGPLIDHIVALLKPTP